MPSPSMRRKSVLPQLSLSSGEEEALLALTRRAKTARAVADRARVVLACAGGKTNSEVAEYFHMTRSTVGRAGPASTS